MATNAKTITTPMMVATPPLLRAALGLPPQRGRCRIRAMSCWRGCRPALCRGCVFSFDIILGDRFSALAPVAPYDKKTPQKTCSSWCPCPFDADFGACDPMVCRAHVSAGRAGAHEAAAQGNAVAATAAGGLVEISLSRLVILTWALTLTVSRVRFRSTHRAPRGCLGRHHLASL